MITNNSPTKYNIKITNPPEENNFKFKRSNSEKKNNFTMINNKYFNEKDNVSDFKTEIKNKNAFNFDDIKKKLENIKTRTKYLLEYYSSNNNNNKIII